MTDKTAIVTGAASGLGAAMALKLGDMGYNVVVVDLCDPAKAEGIINDLKAKGVGAVFAQCDVSDYDSCKAAVQTTVDNFGDTINVLVNSAGIPSDSPYLDIAPERYTKLISIDLLGTMHMCHTALPYMVNHDACIVNIASVSGMTGVANQADYCAAKSGVIGLSRALATEFASQGVRVNAIAPGMIQTPLMDNVSKETYDSIVSGIPMGHVGEPNDVAEGMAYLVNAKFMTGQTLSMNGGWFMS